VKKLICLLFFFALLYVSCTNSPVIDNSKLAGELINQAVMIMNEFPDSALILLDKAIALDKNCQAAFNSKAVIYCSKGEYEKAIEMVKRLLELNPGLAEGVVMLGMLYDYTNQPGKAMEQYQEAIDLFDKRLVANKDVKSNRMNRAHALLLSGNEIEGNEEIRDLLMTDSENTLLQEMMDFDKRKYLNSIFSNSSH